MNPLKAKYAGSRPLVKVLQWMGAVMLLFVLAVLIVSVLKTLCGWSLADTNYLRTVQALQTLCVFFLPPFVVAYLWSEQPLRWLHLQKTSCPAVLLLLVPLSMVIAAPGINLLAHLNEQMSLPAFLQPLEEIMKEMELRAAALTEQFLQVHSVKGLLVNILIMALLPAMGEELTFRGLLLNSLTRQSDESVQTARRSSFHIAVWVVAILFSAIHLQFYGFFPRMLIGAYLGYLLLWSGSLWLPILAHFTNNAIAVTTYYIVFRSQTDTSVLETIGTGDTLWLGITSLVLSLLLIFCIYRITTFTPQHEVTNTQ